MTRFAVGSLFLRHASRTVPFQLLFTAIPARPGSFALDQKVRSTVPESNTLVSPEILARAPAGETRTVRRCFDPPAGWRFERARARCGRRRAAGLDRRHSRRDDEQRVGRLRARGQPSQICIAVVAKAATKTARTATIGRFEATLVRDVATERVVQSGVRLLDWSEPVRVPLESGNDRVEALRPPVRRDRSRVRRQGRRRSTFLGPGLPAESRWTATTTWCSRPIPKSLR